MATFNLIQFQIWPYLEYFLGFFHLVYKSKFECPSQHKNTIFLKTISINCTKILPLNTHTKCVSCNLFVKISSGVYAKLCQFLQHAYFYETFTQFYNIFLNTIIQKLYPPVRHYLYYLRRKYDHTEGIKNIGQEAFLVN